MTAAFSTMLRVELETDDTGDEGAGNWKLIDPLVYHSDLLGGETITVPPGFVTDLASVPRWIGVYDFAGARADRAAVIHDYLIATRPDLNWKAKAGVFREAMLATGYREEVADAFYAAVVAHGILSHKA